MFVCVYLDGGLVSPAWHLVKVGKDEMSRDDVDDIDTYVSCMCTCTSGKLVFNQYLLLTGVHM